MAQKIGILTGGGDCPGLNAAIRAIVRKGIKDYRMKFFGIEEGWAGLLHAKAIPLDRDGVSGLLMRGGTILGSTPSQIFHEDVQLEKLMKGYKRLQLDSLIVIGGDSTLGVASRMFAAGLNIVGVPKTIDNDIMGTERTIGFSTAVQVAVEAIDRVHTTAESHHRVMIVEVMGRHAGWIAVMSGLAAGADLVLIPEKPFDMDEVCEIIKKRHKFRNFTIVVVAEGAHPQGGKTIKLKGQKDAFGYDTLGGISYWLKVEIEKRTGFDARASVLGHIQRGGTPSHEDRILATRFGVKAVELVKNKEFGYMVGLQGDEIVKVPLNMAIKDRKVPDYWYDIAKTFFG
ncbi:MAG: 6-phosphofructokinase [Candidatus Altiarchaeota archaeon]|nr:6-phosphofructokinase [Candidatus Altiarchaeota archaeon]